VVVSHGGTVLGALEFEGTARLLTPPFVPASPVDDVELRVEGDPQPIPRPMTLWNRWVEHDPRPLSVGVSEIRAVEADAAPPEAERRRYTPDEVRAQLLYEGLHADDWLAGRFTLFLPPSVRVVRLGLGVEPLGAGAGPSAARLLLEDRLLRSVAFAAHGDAEVTVELPPAGSATGLRALALSCERPLRLPTRDTADVDMRRISYRLRWLEIR
jgi:hypothetical protein